MNIRKRASKKAKSGYVYEVFLTYKEDGITMHYSKRGFESKREALSHSPCLANIDNTAALIIKISSLLVYLGIRIPAYEFRP